MRDILEVMKEKEAEELQKSAELAEVRKQIEAMKYVVTLLTPTVAVDGASVEKRVLGIADNPALRKEAIPQTPLNTTSAPHPDAVQPSTTVPDQSLPGWGKTMSRWP